MLKRVPRPSGSLMKGTTEHELKLIAGVLGTEGTAREVEAYVALEQKKWKDVPMRIDFLNSLIVVVADEIQKFEFYRDPECPREFPLPERVAVFNADKGVHDRTIPLEEFLDNLRSIVRSSVFKR